jgi:hypothetical protein
MLELIADTKGTVGPSKGIKHTLEKAANLLPGVISELDTNIDATLLSSLVRASADPLQLTDLQLQATAQKLLSIKSTPSVKTAFKVLAGVQAVAGFPNAPFALVLPKPVLKPSEPLKLEIRNILGQKVNGASVTIERLTLPTASKEIDSYRDTQLQSTGPADFESEYDNVVRVCHGVS